jgi:hypothetical protein
MDVSQSAFDWRYLLGVAIPLVLLLVGALSKSLIASEILFEHFFFGLDFSLAALASLLANVVDLLKDLKDPQFPERMGYAIAFFVICFCVYFVILVIHQRAEKKYKQASDTYAAAEKSASAVDAAKQHFKSAKVSRGVWLGLVSNVIGFSLVFGFIMMKTRGTL